MRVILFIFIGIFMCERPARAQKLLVRVYDTPQTVAGVDIAGCKFGEWVDVIVTQEELSSLRVKEFKSLRFEIIAEDIEKLLESVKGFYHSYSGFVDTLTQIAINHPNIAKLDTIGVSWEGREILAMKISDNVWLDEDEPEILFDGLHHAREWPTLEICLFYADTLTEGYGISPHITNVVNSNEIWIVPCVNPDGYVYCHDEGHAMWRKNRRPPKGVDLNRNYNGSCDGSGWGAWGAIDNRKTSHDPYIETYCGGDAFSEYETQAIRDIVVLHNFTFYVTYHTYGEMVMWPWGYTGTGAPDSIILSDIGYNMAQWIARQGGGTYDAFQCYYLYPTSGTSKEWAYGYSLYIQGMPTLAYTIEACNEFQPPQGALNQIVKENFDGAIYLCDIADSIRNLLVPRIIPPIIAEIDTSIGDYTISWSTPYPADKYRLVEFKEFSAIEDGAEDSSGLWFFNGFTRSTSNHHNGSYSYFSASSNDNMTSMTTRYPLPTSDSLTFWCKYNISTLYNCDHVFVEVSPDCREMKILDSLSGSSGGWVRKSYSLPPYKSSFIRFRYTTDDGGLGAGFYVDELYPIPKFDSLSTISDNITDTFYTMSGKPPNTYWYYVNGYNSRGWGDYSQIEDVIVVQPGANEYEGFKPLIFTCSPNPCYKRANILYNLPKSSKADLKIYDIAGRLVKAFSCPPETHDGPRKVVLEAKDFTPGIYFITLTAKDFRKSLKIALIH